MINKHFYVYILSNFTKTVLYIGVTSNIIKRVWEHKKDLVAGFTQRYQVHDLVYFETYEDPMSAIEREKQIKNYSRKKKEQIILEFNPKLEDLSEDLAK